MARLTKQFIIRKYVMAQTAAEAIKLERKYQVSDVFVDEEWLKQNPELVAKHIGFKHGKKE